MKHALIIIAISAMLYITGATAAASFNLAVWNEFFRGMLALLWMVGVIGYTVVCQMTDTRNASVKSYREGSANSSKGNVQ